MRDPAHRQALQPIRFDDAPYGLSKLGPSLVVIDAFRH
jgi:hypothetical protein